MMMLKSPRGAGLAAALLVAPLVAWGCGGNTNPPQSTTAAPPATQPAPPADGPKGGATEAEGPRGNTADRGKLKPIMAKIGANRDKNSLTNLLNEELKGDEPAWDKVQPQAAEYAKLAAEIGKIAPPRGEKAAFTKLADAFAESASALDKAAQAKDLAAVKAAHNKLNGSCMACHREHRGGAVAGGFGGGGFGAGGFGAGGFGGGFTFPPPTQVLSPFLQDWLQSTPEQKKKIEDLQKEVDAELEKMLTDEQKKQLKEMKENTGRGGFPGFGPGGPGGPGAPGGNRG